jgi:hypothetical protein
MIFSVNQLRYALAEGDVELNPGPTSSSSSQRVPRCCRCNRSGLCRNCSCVKAGNVCVSCFPKDLGSCVNQSSGCTSKQMIGPSPMLTTSQTSQMSSVTINSPNPSFSLPHSPTTVHMPPVSLPSLQEICSLTVPTLQHVPKGVRDGAWARVIGDVLGEISSIPDCAEGWSKLFMLARCILYNPPRSGRSHWREKLIL